jgi:hypothetical protein
MARADEPAFPQYEIDDEACENRVYKLQDKLMSPGLTKREYFAGLAMQGLAAFGNGESYISLEKTPEEAVKMADALLAELEKKE